MHDSPFALASSHFSRNRIDCSYHYLGFGLFFSLYVERLLLFDPLLGCLALFSARIALWLASFFKFRFIECRIKSIQQLNQHSLLKVVHGHRLVNIRMQLLIGKTHRSIFDWMELIYLGFIPMNVCKKLLLLFKN